MVGRAQASEVLSGVAKLRWIKSIHTLVWAFFAAAIVAIPIAAVLLQFRAVLMLALVVMGEVTVLALNGMRCPLTDVAARYTADRRSNFDIYLPELLASYNKQVFGGLFVAGLGFALVRWMLR